MASANEIYKTVNRLCERFGTRDPFRLAKALHIEVMVRELGGLKGFYKVIYDSAFLFLSASLSEREARLICAHELGHHILHRSAAAYGFEEVSLFSPTSKREYEANLFAAELLLCDSDIRELAAEGYTKAQMATALGADEKLTELKCAAFSVRNSR